MAVSSCPRCEGSAFESKPAQPAGSRFKVRFIQCASCGTVVGVLEYFDVGTMVQMLGEKLGIRLE